MKLSIPAWAGSVIFHVVGLLLLFWLIRSESVIRGAPGVERTDHIGIVLKSESNHRPVYRNETEIFESNPKATELPELQEPLIASPTNFNPNQFLPKTVENVIGPIVAESGGNSGASDRMTDQIGAGLKGGGSGTNSEATVGLFSLTGTGHRFAFVFDRSESMGEQGGKPIRAAKAELIQSLDSLQSVHQLLIVFYNEAPLIYPSGEQSGRLVFATDDNKEAAQRFIRSIVPSGGTNHENALVFAAKLNPDVIFLLTDGESKDDPRPPQLDRISKASGGIQINVIQFGLGPEPPNRGPLKLLATQNAGLYQYIDIGTL